MRPAPTARELEELAETFRQSPRSTAFVPLADAYLAALRPRDALEVLNRGLQAHPDLPEARLALGRAHVMLHQWMEAQAELLRAVKLDRQNREAFRLLGEVLMRSSDFERALQVLQHAHNLNPADPQVLGMLKRAREGRPLDPPPPVPAPTQGSGPVRRPPQPQVGFDTAPTKVADPEYVDAALTDDDERIEMMSHDAEPTNVAPPPRPAPPRAPLPKARPAPQAPTRALRPIAQQPTIQHQPPAQQPTIQAQMPGRDDPTEIDDPGSGPVGFGLEVEQARVSRRPELPKPEGGRPRLEHAPHKQQGEGADAMRRSAAVGEDYLNQLLGGGLLDVPNVEARPMSDDGVPVKRWGRSRLPIFILIWLVTLGGLGALGWYVVIPYWQQRNQNKIPADVPGKIAKGSSADFADVEETLLKLLAKNPRNEVAAAALSEVRALSFLVYGDGTLADVEAGIAATSVLYEKRKPDAPGQHEMAVAKAARAVAAAMRAADAEAAFRDAGREVARGLEAWPDDGILLWMAGVVAQESGDRGQAKQDFSKADAAGAGPPIARIALGDMKLDEGDAAGALADYENALARAPHPMAVVGRALVRVEQKGDTEAAMQDLNVNLAEVKGTRLEAWKHLALGAVYTRLEDFEKSKAELDAAASSGNVEPRFLARVALARLDRGQIVDALRLRTLIRGVSDVKTRDPVGAVLSAELLLTAGLPRDALETLGAERTDVRARLARGRALLDAGDPAKAEKELAAALAAAPGDLRAEAFHELARVAAKMQTRQALEALQKLARASVSPTPRYVLGEAYVLLGQSSDAKRELEASIAAEGNPLAYRARTRLAEIHIAAGQPAEAEKALRAALDQAPGYAPAHATLGRILLAQGKAEEALKELQIVIDQEIATAADELTYAEAAMGVGDKDTAVEAVRRAKIKAAPADQLARVVMLIDPALLTELGLPKPK